MRQTNSTAIHHRSSRVLALAWAIGLLGACAQPGDDPFAKLPDASVIDALVVSIDAHIVADASGQDAAASDAGPAVDGAINDAAGSDSVGFDAISPDAL